MAESLNMRDYIALDAGRAYWTSGSTSGANGSFAVAGIVVGDVLTGADVYNGATNLPQTGANGWLPPSSLQIVANGYVKSTTVDTSSNTLRVTWISAAAEGS